MIIRKQIARIAANWHRLTTNKPNILILDIETAPVLGSVWSLWKQNVGLNQIAADWFIMSWCAKWLGEREVHYFDQRNCKGGYEKDAFILGKIWEMLDQADIVVAHNGRSFDVKKLNARFILNGMRPPSPFKVVDTLEIAKARFKFTSNKLEYLTDKLCTEKKKLKHAKFPGFELWKECLAGNPEAWDEMRDYNIEDVLSLEELYMILRPWDERHPNVNVFDDLDNMRCRVCGSDELYPRGWYHTNSGQYKRFQCACGAWNRSRYTLNTTCKRKELLT